MRMYRFPLSCYRVQNRAINTPLLIHLRENEGREGN
jgi:hypothetical protein